MSAKLIQVIDVEEHRGDGTEDNPHRIVRAFYLPEGAFVMSRDLWQEDYRRGCGENVMASLDVIERELQSDTPRIDIFAKATMVIRSMLKGIL